MVVLSGAVVPDGVGESWLIFGVGWGREERKQDGGKGDQPSLHSSIAIGGAGGATNVSVSASYVQPGPGYADLKLP